MRYIFILYLILIYCVNINLIFVALFNDQPELLNSFGPFGDADASRVDFQKLRKSFINLTNIDGYYDPTTDTDASVRVIIGKRGAGKTLYLRSIQEYCRTQADKSVYWTEIDNEPPDTELIIKVTSWFDNESDADEFWRRIWKVVILRTLYNHIFFSKELKKYVTHRHHQEIINRFKILLPKYQSPVLILTQLSDFLNKFNSLKDLKNFLSLEEWSEFEVELGSILKSIPPVYFFLDQLDDNFAHAPYQWLKCQYGLFNTIFRFIRNQTYGGRLHIVVCIREIVYAYILQTEHGNKYLSESKIKVLRWDFELAEHFLEKKIQSLDSSYVISGSDKIVASFFGQQYLPLKRLDGYLEDISKYILRHTLLMPRDIINIGNIYYEKRRNNLSGSSNEKIIRESVRHVAKNIAQDQLSIASIFITTKWIYNGAVENGDLNAYVDGSMREAVKANLRKLILRIGKDRFSVKRILSLKEKIRDFGFTNSDDPFNALFLAGLLGYVEVDAENNKQEIFFSESRNAQYLLPLHWKQYVFHSSLIDYLGIKPIGSPVYA